MKALYPGLKLGKLIGQPTAEHIAANVCQIGCFRF
jgi:hypothetical protein